MPKNLVALPRSQLPVLLELFAEAEGVFVFRGMITNNHVIHIEKYKEFTLYK